LDYLSVVRRRRWWLVVPLVLSVFVGLALVRFLPKEYQSSTTLAVSAPAVAPNLINQTRPFDNPERLRALSQLLFSPRILERVVREEQLASGAEVDAEIARLRRAIEVNVSEPLASIQQPRLDSFEVLYTDQDPARAQ